MRSQVTSSGCLCTAKVASPDPDSMASQLKQINCKLGNSHMVSSPWSSINTQTTKQPPNTCLDKNVKFLGGSPIEGKIVVPSMKIAFEKKLLKKSSTGDGAKPSINSMASNKSGIFSNPFLELAKKQRWANRIKNSGDVQFKPAGLIRLVQPDRPAQVEDSDVQEAAVLRHSSSSHEPLDGCGEKKTFYLPNPRSIKKRLTFNNEVKDPFMMDKAKERRLGEFKSGVPVKALAQVEQNKTEGLLSTSMAQPSHTKKMEELSNFVPNQSATCIILNESDIEPSLSSKLPKEKNLIAENLFAQKQRKLFTNFPCNKIEEEPKKDDYTAGILAGFSRRIVRSVPCIYHAAREMSHSSLSKQVSLLLYFHANAEDLGSSCHFLKQLVKMTGVPAFASEYPGYSVYPGVPSEEQIFEDSEHVFKFVSEMLRIPAERILVVGRSLGTAVASHVCTKFKAHSLVLLSPLASTGQVAAQNYGALLKVLIKDRFNNLEMAPLVQCPTLIIHGGKDDIIHPAQSEAIKSSLGSYRKS